jgi:uncharacterized protein (TIGR00730 family)
MSVDVKPNTRVRRVAVYCGSSPGNDPRFIELAGSFGRALAAADFGLVYGGGQAGLMGALADGVLSEGGEVIGVIPDFLLHKEVAYEDPRVDLRVVRSMHERKALYYTLADAFVALPGGYGTFEELFEVLAWARLGLVCGPIILLNADGYYDTAMALLDVALASGFVNTAHRAIVSAEPNVATTMERLIGYSPSP